MEEFSTLISRWSASEGQSVTLVIRLVWPKHSDISLIHWVSWKPDAVMLHSDSWCLICHHLMDPTTPPPSMAYHHHPANGSRYSWSVLTQGQAIHLGLSCLSCCCLRFVLSEFIWTESWVFMKSYRHDLKQHSREGLLKLCANVIFFWKVLDNLV